jgi:peroxin-6
MYALCSDAMLKAITRQARAVDKKVKEHNDTHDQEITIAYFFDHFATEEDTAVMVTEQDYMEAHKELVPSVSADELRHYDRVRRTFEGAGKQGEEKKKQIEAPPPTNGVSAATKSSKGKGKAVAPVDEAEELVIRAENVDLNGDAGSGSGAKGKGKASASGHASKTSVDIAAGGFGDAGDDEELYS